jgi:enoyl-[acyl-carrier-protein] reductase (NADH)
MLSEQTEKEITERTQSLSPMQVHETLQVMVQREIKLFESIKQIEDEADMIEIVKHNIAVLTHACARFEEQAEFEKQIVNKQETDSTETE